MGLVAGCLASAALHGGLFAMATLFDFSPARAGWHGSSSFGSEGDGEPPSFSIRVRVTEATSGSAPVDASAVLAGAHTEFFAELAAPHATAAVAPASQPSDLSGRPQPQTPAAVPAAVAAGGGIAVEPEQAAEPTLSRLEPRPTATELAAPTALAPLQAGAAEEAPRSASPADDFAPRTSNETTLASDQVGVPGPVRNPGSESAADTGAESGSARALAAGDAGPARNTGPGAAGQASGTEPPPTFAPAPSYPPLSRRLGEEGKVHVCLSIARSGRVLSVEIVQSSGHARLDRAAIETLSRWRFAPRPIDDERATTRVLHCVTFRLQ